MVQDLKTQGGVLPRRALVTGATGFVGTALCDALRQQNWDVRRALRTGNSLASIDDAVVGDIGPATDWRVALRGVDVVIHLAARTHVMRDTAADPLAAYRRLNVEGTQTLTHAAQAAGVRRFIFLSSIKVNGEATTLRPYTENDAPQPEDRLRRFEAGSRACTARGRSRHGNSSPAPSVALRSRRQRQFPAPDARDRARHAVAIRFYPKSSQPAVSGQSSRRDHGMSRSSRGGRTNVFAG